MKKFVVGVVVGAALSFPLGFNFGRDVPLFSNPFAKKAEFRETVTDKAKGVVDTTREVIHDATEPARKEGR